MKVKGISAFLVILLVIFLITSYAETKKLKEVGRYTLVRIKGEIPTEQVMKTVLDRYTGDIKYGFDLVGYGDLFLPFIEQIKAASFEEKEIPVGDKIMWMLFRSKGKVKAVEDIEWAGKAPLKVFSFIVKKDFKHYEFIMPRPCGNVGLRKVEEIVPDAICGLKVTPEKANLNDPISVDMSGTQYAQSMEVEVFDSSGTKVASKSLTPDSPRWQTSFDKPGEYIFKGKALNPKGKPSENPCEAKIYINYPPKSNLICKPCEEYIKKPILFDASGSSDQDGEVVKANFEILNEAGNVVDRFETAKPFTWEKVFEKAGTYAVTVVVTDDFGAVSEPVKVEVKVKQKLLFALFEGGPLIARGSYGEYLLGRVGLAYRLVPDTLSFVLSGGGALALKGEPWKSFAMGSALFNLHARPTFFGAGVGVSTQVREEREETDFLLIGQVGYDVFDKYTSIGSIFVEGHAPLGEGRKLSKHHKLLLGFRFLF